MFPEEPESNDEEFVSPLRGLDNVLLTPHIGGSTAEAQEAIGVEVAEKLLSYSNNGSTLSAVNFPEVALPGHPGKHRAAAHPPQPPGHAVARQRRASPTRRINVAAQYLQTNPRIGYVVIDVDPDPDADSPRAASRTRGARRHHQGPTAVLTCGRPERVFIGRAGRARVPTYQVRAAARV